MNIKFKSSTSVNVENAPPIIAKLAKACEKIADGDVVDSLELSTRSKFAQGSVTSQSCHPLLAQFTHKIKGKRWFGNKNTIAELKKQFA